jgi:signal peptidase II
MTAVPRSRYFLFFAIAIGGCLLDLASKAWMFRLLGLPGARAQPLWFWPDVFGVESSLNEGALFGMGQGMWTVFAGLSVAAAVGVLIWFFRGGARSLLLTLSLASITAGIAGNLYDRLGLHGLRWTFDSPLHRQGDAVHAVPDWILVLIGRWHWPNFNVADSMLVVGAVVLMIHAVYYSENSQDTQFTQDKH